MAGVVSCASHLLTAFFPKNMWFGQQVLQGAVLSTALVRCHKKLKKLFFNQRDLGFWNCAFVCRIRARSFWSGVWLLGPAVVAHCEKIPFVCFSLFQVCLQFVVLVVFLYLNPSGLSTCSDSKHCLFNSFLFCAALCLLGAVLAGVAAVLTRRETEAQQTARAAAFM